MLRKAPPTSWLMWQTRGLTYVCVCVPISRIRIIWVLEHFKGNILCTWHVVKKPASIWRYFKRKPPCIWWYWTFLQSRIDRWISKYGEAAFQLTQPYSLANCQHLMRPGFMLTHAATNAGCWRKYTLRIASSVTVTSSLWRICWSYLDNQWT